MKLDPAVVKVMKYFGLGLVFAVQQSSSSVWQKTNYNTDGRDLFSVRAEALSALGGVRGLGY